MLLLLSTLAFAQNNTTCTATDNSGLVYQSWGKSGGAHPGPDTIMASETWLLDDVAIHQVSRPYMNEPIVTGVLEWTWDEPDKGPPSPDKGLMSEWTYVTRATVWTTDETPLAEGAPIRLDRVRMKCTAQAFYGIP